MEDDEMAGLFRAASQPVPDSKAGDERVASCAASASHFLAVCTFNGYGVEADAAKAVSMWEELSTKDQLAMAQHELGVRYREGGGAIAQDHGKALTYFQQAAGRGHPEALCDVAHYQHVGVAGVVAKDEALAVSNWKQAAEQGIVAARQKLEELGIK